MVTTLASLCLVVAGLTGIGSLTVVGYGLIAIVGFLAALGAFADFCFGCRMYRQVSLFKGWKLLTTPAEDLEEISRL